MTENQTHAERFRRICQWVASTQGAADLILALEARSLHGSVIPYQELFYEVLRFGTMEERLRTIRALRAMGAIEARDGGFRLTSETLRLTAALQMLLYREVQRLETDEYVDAVMAVLEKQNKLPPDPSTGTHSNRIEIASAIAALAPLITVTDAASWMTRPRENFDGAMPVDICARGEIDRVIAVIKSAGLALYF